VGVITNGTAVLGLGAIGPLAAKPVMEGKAVLFKKFAGIDVFDIEVEQRDPLKLVELGEGLSPVAAEPAVTAENYKRALTVALGLDPGAAERNGYAAALLAPQQRLHSLALLNFGNCARGWLLLIKSILHSGPEIASLGPISVTHAPAPAGRRSRVRAGTWPSSRRRTSGPMSSCRP